MQVEWLECNQIAPDVIDTVKRERVVGYELSVCPGAASVHPAASITRDERVFPPPPRRPRHCGRPRARVRPAKGLEPGRRLRCMIRGGPDLASRRRAEPKRARARAPKFG